MRLSESTDAPSRLLVNVKEAARMLSIGESTLWRLVRAGKLPAPVKIGSATRWRMRDLEQQVDGLTDGAQPPQRAPASAGAGEKGTFLTNREVCELTGISRGEAGASREQRQVAALRLMRVPHYVNPPGRVLVPRAAVDQGLLTPVQSVPGRGVNWAAIK